MRCLNVIGVSQQSFLLLLCRSQDCLAWCTHVSMPRAFSGCRRSPPMPKAGCTSWASALRLLLFFGTLLQITALSRPLLPTLSVAAPLRLHPPPRCALRHCATAWLPCTSGIRMTCTKSGYNVLAVLADVRLNLCLHADPLLKLS